MAGGDALERAMDMLAIPMNRLPRLAIEYLADMKKRVGLCIEVCITAYAAYAQCVEGCAPSSDPAYRAGPDAEKFFTDHMTEEDRTHLIEEAFKPLIVEESPMPAKLKKITELTNGDVIQVPDQLAAFGVTHGRIESIGTALDRPGYCAITLSPDGKPDERVDVYLANDGVVPTR